jgi:hypothetical protein
MMAEQQGVELTQYLKELRLLAIRECYQDLAEQAREEALSYEQYLFSLVGTEREARRNNRIARLLRESRLPLEKSLDSFDRKRLPRKVDAHLGVLLDGTFLDRLLKQNLSGHIGAWSADTNPDTFPFVKPQVQRRTSDTRFLCPALDNDGSGARPSRNAIA